MPTIPIDLPEPPTRVFQLATPRHMFMKLHWEIRNLKAALESQGDELPNHLNAAYSAFNTAVTAWHLTDWVWHSMPRDHQIEAANDLGLSDARFDLFKLEIRKRSPEVAICWDIANGSKHKKEREGCDIKASLSWTTVNAVAGNLRTGQRLSAYKYDLVISDNNVERRAIEVFSDAYVFWRRLLSKWGFLEDVLITGDNEWDRIHTNPFDL